VKEILGEFETASDWEVNRKGIESVTSFRSKGPFIGYN